MPSGEQEWIGDTSARRTIDSVQFSNVNATNLFLRAKRRTNLPLLFEDPRSGADSTPLWTGFTRWGAAHSSLSPTAMAAIARA
jgi:hypothetical protein